MSQADEFRGYGAILQHAHELILTQPHLSFGEALDRAKKKHNGIAIPKDIEDKMLLVLFKIALKGFPSDIEA